MSLTRWIVILFLTLPALAIVLFGPRPDESLPPDVVVIDYWEKWTGHEEAQMRQIVDAFNETVGKEKGIYVRYVSTSSVNQKTLIATAAGVPPDVAGLWDFNIVQFGAMEALEPLDELAAEYGITKDYYKPVYWDLCHYDGKLYGLISTPMAAALHYNKRVFEEKADVLRAAGLDPTRAPRTIDELDAYGKALDEITPTGRILRSGYLPTEPGWYLLHLPYWFGGQVWDAENEKFTLTSPEVVAAFTWLQSYSKRLGRDATTEFRSGLGTFDSPQNPFLTGTVAIVQQGPWLANYIYNLKPSMSTVRWPKDVEMTLPLEQRLENYEWAVAPFPSAVPGLEDVTYVGPDVLVIPKGARHKREAFEFIAFVNRQDQMEKLCKLHCKNSPLANVSEDFLNNHPNPYIRIFERLAWSPNARSTPQCPIWPEASSELNTVIQQVVLMKDEPEALLAAAEVKLQAKYEQFKAMQAQRRAKAPK